MRQTYVLQRAREKGAHPVWNVVAMSELLREHGKHLINLPLPETEEEERLNGYVSIFSEAITKSWRVSLFSGKMRNVSRLN